MARIFLQMQLVLAMLLLGACSRDELTPIELPAEASAVSAPFLAALTKGDRMAAEKMSGRYFVDDTRAQFESAHQDLTNAPKLIPIANIPKRTATGTDPNETTVIYAARQGKDWISAEIRLGRIAGEPFEVEYWAVTKGPGRPDVLARGDKLRKTILVSAGVAIPLGLLALVLIFWLVRRKPRVFAAPPPPPRAAARTTRDLLDD